MGILKMRRVAFAFAGIIAATSASAETMTLGGISAFGGGKLLKRDDWAPADEHFEGGARIDVQPANWPFGFTASYALSYGRGDDGSGFGEFRARTREVQLGLERIWAVGGRGMPYVGGGVTIGKAGASLADVQDSDTGVGPWVGGGYRWVFFNHLGLGVNSSYSYFRTRFFDVKVNSGGFHIDGTIGYEW